MTWTWNHLPQIGLAWCAVSIAAGMFIGRCIKGVQG